MNDIKVEITGSFIPVDLKKNKPLLTIELDSITSIPKVFYRGEEVTRKVRVAFEWLTADENGAVNSPTVYIEFLPEDQGKSQKVEVIHHTAKPAIERKEEYKGPSFL
jgi:hypothetical protein